MFLLCFRSVRARTAQPGREGWWHRAVHRKPYSSWPGEICEIFPVRGSWVTGSTYGLKDVYCVVHNIKILRFRPARQNWVVSPGDLYTESGQTLQGSFSALSKPNFASKYSLKALAEIYTMHSFAPLWNRIPNNRSLISKFSIKILNFLLFFRKFSHILSEFCWIFAKC